MGKIIYTAKKIGGYVLKNPLVANDFKRKEFLALKVRNFACMNRRNGFVTAYLQ